MYGILKTLNELIQRLVKYFRDHGLKGILLFTVKALALLLWKAPSKPMLVKTRIGGFLMLVPGDKGISSELLRWRIHEPFLTSELFKRISKGMIVLDIGSNIGYYAVHEAMLVGSKGLVIAVEPQPHVYRALLASFKANGLKNYIAVKRALSKTGGSLEFTISSSSNLSRVCMDGIETTDVLERIIIETSSVDKLVKELKIQRLDLIRMDIEGYEEEIFEGAWDTIEKFKPIICMELHVPYLGFKKSIALLIKLMARGYRIQFAAPRQIDHYPLSSFPYAIYPGGNVKQQLIQIFGRPYMHEFIHALLIYRQPYENGHVR
jgi:FkbM family methyltransferase